MMNIAGGNQAIEKPRLSMEAAVAGICMQHRPGRLRRLSVLLHEACQNHRTRRWF